MQTFQHPTCVHTYWAHTVSRTRSHLLQTERKEIPVKPNETNQRPERWSWFQVIFQFQFRISRILHVIVTFTSYVRYTAGALTLKSFESKTVQRKSKLSGTMRSEQQSPFNPLSVHSRAVFFHTRSKENINTPRWKSKGLPSVAKKNFQNSLGWVYTPSVHLSSVLI